MRLEYLAYQEQSYMESDRNELNLRGKCEICCILLIVEMSDWNFYLWLNWLKLNEDWWIVVSEESLVKYNNFSNKWGFILEDNNLLFLYVLTGNVFSIYKCHQNVQSVLYLMFIIIVILYL